MHPHYLSCRTQVFHCEGSIESLLQHPYLGMVPSDDQHVVHVQKEYQEVTSFELLYKHAEIGLRFVIPLVGHEGVELPVPLSGSLPQSVQALLQPANHVILALYLGVLLASPSFNLYTHLFRSDRFPFDNSTSSYVSFSCRESI